MKIRILALSVMLFVILLSCKKEPINTTSNEPTPTVAKEKPTNVTSTDDVTPFPNEDNSDQVATSTPLNGTAWYAFINMREPGDIHNYFIRYAEYHFQEFSMEFFANMVNGSRETAYAMRADSVFFMNGNNESFQFKILDRSENKMKIQAPSGKTNVCLKISESDLKLSRKERIRAALMRLGKFEEEEINARFESIDSIKIN